jgi:GNAT superfamily N-acetyltransferase
MSGRIAAMDDLVSRAMELWRGPLPPGDAGLAAFRSVYADPVFVNGAPTSVEVLAERARMMQSAIGDMTHHVHDVFVAPGRRAFAFRITGQHVGTLTTPLGTVAATGRAIDILGIDMFEVDETTERVTAIWALADHLGLLSALDAIVPAAALSRAAADGQLAAVTGGDSGGNLVPATAAEAEIRIHTTAADEVEIPADSVDTFLRATAADAAEILVLQRCCWVAEALANETLEIPALHESLEEVREWLDSWSVWCVRSKGRLIGAVRARRDGTSWEIGRLMVAPDLAGRGLGRRLLAHAEAHAPADIETIELFTGARSERNISIYERAGFHRTDAPAPPGAVNLVKPLGSR